MKTRLQIMIAFFNRILQNEYLAEQNQNISYEIVYFNSITKSNIASMYSL